MIYTGCALADLWWKSAEWQKCLPSQEICYLKTNGELSVIASGLSSGIASFPTAGDSPAENVTHAFGLTSLQHNLLIGDVQSREMGLSR
jgi:hypothetical protein